MAEEERRRRRPRPVPGETPDPGGVEVMPAELNDPEVAPLPAGILERADEQPLV